MSIADKILIAKAVYDAVYEAGKQSMIDPTKIIEKTVSGTLIRVDDVSEIPHKCTVSADKETYATVCGKNLLPFVASNIVQGIALTQDADGTIHISGTATANAWFYITPSFTLPIAEYVLSVHNANFSTGVDNFGYKYKSNTHNVTSLATAISGLRSYATNQIDVIEFRVPQGTTLNDATFQIQLEQGITKADYEVYKGKSYAVKPNQSVEIDSICPTMIASSSNGAHVSLDYHKSWGIQTEYDRFWDAYQDNGNRVLYQYAYAYMGWNGTTYNPKHIDKPTNASNMFYESQVPIVKNLDLSNCTNEDQLCRNSKIEDAGVIDTSKTSLLYYTFHNAQALHTLKLILKDNGTQTFNGAFFRNYALENLEVVGTIGNNGLTFADATKLTHESLMSILEALQYHVDVYTKTTEVCDVSNVTDLSVVPYYKCYTTTGEQVYDIWDTLTGDPRYEMCCLVDGVYYIVTRSDKTTTYTLTLGATNLAKLSEKEIAEATQKGWTLV